MAVAVDDIEGRASVSSVSSYKEICTRTSWVDARTALAHITKGRASGSRGSLWLRSVLQGQLQQAGEFCDRHAGKVIFVALLVLASFCVGLKSATLVTDIEQLWVQDGGRLQQELQYVEETLGKGAGSTKQLLIQTAKEGPGVSLLNSEALLTHLAVLQASVDVTVDLYDTTWSLSDICYAPTFPEFDTYQVEQIFEGLNPCTIITPLDCFWEGSFLLGPKYPVTIPGLGSGVRWSNLNPAALVQKIEQVKGTDKSFPLGSFVEFLKRAGITTGYQTKPCLDPLDPDCPDTAPNKGSRAPVDVGAAVTGGCYGFAARYMHWPEHLIVGAVTKNKTGHIVRGEALQSIVQLMGSKNLYDYWRYDWRVHNIVWTQDKAQQILDAWMNKFMMKVSSTAAALSEQTRPYRLLPFSDATLAALIKRFSELSLPKVVIGYSIMLVYAAAVLCRPWDPARSQAGLAIAGVLLVALSFAAGMGFCALLGLPFTAASTQVLPFLALGLSVDHVFVLLHTAAETFADPSLTRNSSPAAIRRAQVGAVVKRCGISLLMSSLCTSMGFACAALVPVPALRSMCLQAALLIIVNLVVVLLVFPALLSLDLRRRNLGRADVFCCFPAPPPLDEEDGGHPPETRGGNSSDTICCLPQPNSGSSPSQREDCSYIDGKHVPLTELNSTSSTTPSGQGKKPSDLGGVRPAVRSEQQEWNAQTHQVLTPSVDSMGSTRSLFSEGLGVGACIRKACDKVWLGYVSCVSSDKCRAVGIVLLLATVAASVWGVSRLKDGLSLTALVPSDSSESAFLEAQQKHFSIYHMFAVTKGHFEYPSQQKLLHEYHATFTRVPYILKDDDGGLSDSWLAKFRDWLLGLQESFDRDWQNGCITEEKWHSNASDDGVMAYKLLVQTGHVGHPVDLSLVTKARLVDAEGIINPQAFYNYLSAWATNDAMALSASQADLQPEPKSWHHDRYNDYDLKIPKSSPLVFAQMSFYLRHLNDTESITDMITQVRDICDKFVERGLPNFPRGIPFTFWEQYIHLRFFLVLALVSVVTGVFLVVAVFLLNAWAAALTVLLVSLLAFQLAGLMGIAGIPLSAASAVLLVASVGVGMQFTVHVLLGFLTSVGCRRRRVAAALYHMAPPVVHGALSTLITALMLLFSEFDFIRRCFFYVVAGLVVVGATDGLFFLPILLSILGPPADLTSHAHPDRLPTPTPPPSPLPSPHLSAMAYHQQQPTSGGRTSSSSRRVGLSDPVSGRGGASSSTSHMNNNSYVSPVMTSSSGGGYHHPRHHHHHHGGSNLSLSTITEEPPSSHSTNSCQSSTNYSTRSSHEIVVEPQVVVETTTYGSGAGESPGGEGGGHVTTKVTATAKVKVELHTPMMGGSTTSSSSSSNNSSRRSKRNNNNNSSNNNGANSPTVSVHTNNTNTGSNNNGARSNTNHYRNNNLRNNEGVNNRISNPNSNNNNNNSSCRGSCSSPTRRSSINNTNDSRRGSHNNDSRRGSRSSSSDRSSSIISSSSDAGTDSSTDYGSRSSRSRSNSRSRRSTPAEDSINESPDRRS